MEDDEIIKIWRHDSRGVPLENAIKRLVRMMEARTIERCAKVCESLINEETGYVWIPDSKGAIEECAAAIRALKDDRG